MSEEHATIILPVCIEIFKRLEGKVDVILEKTDALTNKFEEMHGIREKIKTHDEEFAQLDIHRRWAIGMQITTMVTIALQIGSFLYLWGALNKQVDVNTGRLSYIEEIHPRVTK